MNSAAWPEYRLANHALYLLHLSEGVIETAGIVQTAITNAPLTLSQWSSSGNPVAIQSAWNLDLSVHWNATGESQCASSGLPVAFQWSSSVFQLCKLTLDRHWDTTGC